MSAASKQPIERLLSSGQRIAVTDQDEKNLRRVFNHLAGFSRRQQLNALLHQKQDEFKARRQAKDGESNGRESPFSRVGSNGSTAGGSGNHVQSAADAHHERSLGLEIDQLKREVHELESDANKKISARDLDNALRAFGNPYSRKQVEVSFLPILLLKGFGVTDWRLV